MSELGFYFVWGIVLFGTSKTVTYFINNHFPFVSLIDWKEKTRFNINEYIKNNWKRFVRDIVVATVSSVLTIIVINTASVSAILPDPHVKLLFNNLTD